MFTHALIKAGALVLKSGGGKVVKEKSDEIEDSRRLKNHRVTARSDFARVGGHAYFFAGALCQLLRIDVAHAGGVGFGPTGRRILFRAAA